MRKVRLNEGAYSTSKAALRTAVQALALELGPGRIRVNAVAPGWIGGPNVEIFIDWESQNRGISRDDVRREIEARIPLGVIPPQDEIAHSVVFFASPWSKVITGSDARRQRRRVVRLTPRPRGSLDAAGPVCAFRPRPSAHERTLIAWPTDRAGPICGRAQLDGGTRLRTRRDRSAIAAHEPVT